MKVPDVFLVWKFEGITATDCNEVFSGKHPYKIELVSVLETIYAFISHQRLMIEAETVSKTLETSSMFTRLIA